jgi:DNA-binding response OmpR family regulator
VAAHTVLVVDDDPVILRLLEVNFEMEGFEVLTASDGAEGLRRAQQDHPELIICDVMMPVCDGHEVLEKLRADPATRNIPVVLLSARAQETEIQRGYQLGADDYVTKPFDPLDLVERVNALLARTS